MSTDASEECWFCKGSGRGRSSMASTNPLLPLADGSPRCRFCKGTGKRRSADDAKAPVVAPGRPLIPVVVGCHYDFTKGAFLVQRRPADTEEGGLWELPGGKVEGDETLETALEREFAEELGIDIVVGHRICEAVKEPYELILFDIPMFFGTPTPRIGQPEIKFVSLEELTTMDGVPSFALFLPYLARMLETIRPGRLPYMGRRVTFE